MKNPKHNLSVSPAEKVATTWGDTKNGEFPVKDLISINSRDTLTNPSQDFVGDSPYFFRYLLSIDMMTALATNEDNLIPDIDRAINLKD